MMAQSSCLGCHYIMRGSVSPTGKEWCGWLGGTPEPGNPERCHFRVLQRSELPRGLVIANSGRVVKTEDLSAENEAFTNVLR